MIAQLILLVIISSVSSQLLHHAMTPEELGKIFSVESAAEVPNYDIMPISITKPRNRRGVDSYLIQKPFGDGLRIWLDATDGILADTNMRLCQLKTGFNIYNPTKICWENLLENYSLYENKKHAATVSINEHSKGKRSVQGFIDNMYVQPVPPHLMGQAKRHQISVNKTLDHESDNDIYHIVYELPKAHKDILSAPLKQARASNAVHNEKVRVSRTIYPEILVIVDYFLTRRMSYLSIQDNALYLLSFWNGVDMRFRSLEYPKIRLNIAGIYFAMNETVLPYIQSYEKFEENTRLLVNHDAALRNFGNWSYRINHIIPIYEYDIAVTMLPHTLCRAELNSTNPGCTSIGLSWHDGACAVIPNKYTIDKVAFVQDFGNFGGIQTAAHEIGHLLGVRHDNITDNGCDNNDGYIMALSNEMTDHAFDWSKCSLQQMNNFIRSERANCLFNIPRYSEKPFLRYLPGQLWNIDQQCDQLFGARYNFEIKKNQTAIINCHRILCENYNNYRIPVEPAEGTPCGDEKICLHGKCVDVKSIK